MAGTVHRDTPLRCQPTVSNEEPRPFHSWSRINSAGQIVLRDALHILQSPSVVTSMTSNCRKWENVGELETFLRELRQEGHRPTVLHSKDVYRYRSCMTLPLSVGNPPERGGGGNKLTGKRKSGKKRKRPVSKQHPSWSTTERAKPRIKGIRPPDSLMDHRSLLYGSIRVASTASRNTGSPPVVVPRAQPCLRLTNIAGLTGGHTARLQIQTCWDSDTNSTTQQQQNSLTFSGIPSQPSQNGRQPSQNGSRSPPTTAVALLNQKTLSSCPIRMDGGALIGDSAPVIYANGHIFPETDMELTLTRRRNGSHWPQGGHKQQNGLPSGHGVVENGVLNVLKSKNYLRRKVIKIDDSRSLAEARRVAQNILQLNLSPVIQIQPFILRDFRPQYQ